MPERVRRSNPAFQEPLKRSIRGGIRATGLVQAASQLVSLLTLTILYRLIPPDDYGLLGMVLPLLLLLRIFATLGLNISAVQRRQLPHAEASSLFWLSLLLGAGASLATAAVAPALARFYGEPRLTLLTCALAGTSLAVTLGTSHQAMLERDLRLGRLAGARLVGQTAAAALAIAAGLAGWNIWALVVQQYAELIVLAATLWWAHPFRPLAPTHGAPVRHHLHMGGYFAAASLFFFLAGNLDKVLVGRLADARSLGFYSQAFNLMMKPVTVLMTPLTGIVLTALSRSAASPETQTDLLKAFYRLVAVGLLPVGAGLVVVAQPVMLLLGGADWQPAGPLLSILSLAIPAQGLLILTVPIFSATGRTDRLCVASALMTLVVLAACLAGAWLANRLAADMTTAIACAYALAALLLLAGPYTLYCLRRAGQDPRRILATLGRPASAALMMGIAVFVASQLLQALDGLALAVRVALEIGLGVALYTFLARSDVRWLLGQWKQAAPHRAPADEPPTPKQGGGN